MNGKKSILAEKVKSIFDETLVSDKDLPEMDKLLITQMHPGGVTNTYIIVDVSDLDLDSLESDTNTDQAALLQAILKSEFYDETDDLKHIYGPLTKEARPELIDDIATTINNWFGEKRDLIHGLFDFITGLRPAVIAGCEVVKGHAVLEFSDHPDVPVEDPNAVDLLEVEETEDDENTVEED